MLEEFHHSQGDEKNTTRGERGVINDFDRFSLKFAHQDLNFAPYHKLLNY
jgi:hypothetical protein